MNLSMRSGIVCASGVATALALCAGTAAGQTAAINTQGMELRCQLFGPCFPNQSRNSLNNPQPPGTPQLVPAAGGYFYSIAGTVESSGALGLSIPTGSTLEDVVNNIEPGQAEVLRGYVRNPGGAIPTLVHLQRFEGVVFGLDVGLTFRTSLNGTGTATFEVRDINIPLGVLAGSVRITQGTTSVSVWQPSPRQVSEWHFAGSLDAAEGSAGGKIRYLDDPAFGVILGGIGNEDTPNPAAPTGITQAQSAFGTTTGFGIPGPGGEEATVYRTSPARNLADANPDLRRGIGLICYPGARPVFPGGVLGQWSMVWDIYIPQSSWGVEYPLALIEDNDNNDQGADLLIRIDPARGPTIGYGVQPGQYIDAPQIQPGRWMRLAVVNDHPRLNQSRIFVDGALVGVTGGDWLYNFCDPTAPTFGDGEAVPAPQWAAWGEFPNPWASSTGGAQMQSTFCMFADLSAGRSEPVYLSAYAFVDDMLSDTEVAALGGVNAAGIFLSESGQNPCGCAADYNRDDGIDDLDITAFFQGFEQGDACADVNGDEGIDDLDITAFFQVFEAGGC